MKPHKWVKEIIHWANGGQIEAKEVGCTQWKLDDNPYWDDDDWEYRIKPQSTCEKCGQKVIPSFKEPQYLYVYRDYGIPFIREDEIESPDNGVVLLGKIKLETE